MPATSKAAAAKASGGARDSAPTPKPGVRAEFPPAHFWRAWAPDAPPPTFPDLDAEAPAETLPRVLPPAGDAAEAPYRVLVVEDDPSQALFAESILVGTGMQAEVVSVGAEVMDAMQRFRPDLVLTDLHMPGMDGTEITALIRAHPTFAHTPIVFLTGDADPDRQLEVLQIGADDFLTKPVRPRHLVAAVESRVRRARLMQARRGGESPQSTSGLLGRSDMLQHLGTTVPGRTQGAVAFVEVVGLAALRDRFGYAALDTALLEAGQALVAVSTDDPLARINDGTFVVFGPELDAGALEAWARRLRDGIARASFTVDGEAIRLRAVVGYAGLQPGFDDASSALAAAEQALRNARGEASGIAAYVAPDATMDGTEADRVILLNDALENERFELAYQPIVAVAGGDDAQYQTLLRLRDAEGTVHAAADILPAAESAGILHRIDRKVLELALQTLQRRHGESRPVRLFVTQSPRSLTRDGNAEWLLQALDAGGISSGSLVIDVRQQDALIHAVALQEFCTAMVPAGVQLCLSQYSAGSEADALLAQLPLGYVRLAARYSNKLDEGTVRDEMRAAIERAHRLGLQVIGQQVEDPQSAATLWMSGVDFIQGNLVQQAAGKLDFDFHHSVL